MIEWQIHEGVGTMTISLPPSNVLTLDFFNQLGKLIKTSSGTVGLKAIILRGEGRHFSSGADLNELLPAVSQELLYEHHRSFTALHHLNIPVIASIRGVCIGAALELALACHIRIATPEAVFGMPETTFNLIPAIGGIGNMLALSGKANTIELMLRGNTFSAADALAMNLIDATISKHEIDNFVRGLASALPSPYVPEAKHIYLNKYMKKNILNA